MEDSRTSIKQRGEPLFSGTREVVETRTPLDDVISRERDELLSRVEAAQERLKRVERGSNVSAIERAEEALSEAIVAFTQAESGDIEAPKTAEEEEIRSTYFSLSEALSSGSEPERLKAWQAFVAFVFQGGLANPGAAFKNLIAVVRRVNPDLLGGMTQTQVALLLGETRAANCAREIRALETYLKRWGVSGFHLLGDTKSEATRRKLSASQKGNNNRRGTRARKRATKKTTKKKR